MARQCVYTTSQEKAMKDVFNSCTTQSTIRASAAMIHNLVMAVIEKVSVEHPSDGEPIAANNCNTVDITAELLYLRDQKMKMEAEIARKDLEISQQNAKIARQDAEIRDLKQKRSDQDIVQCAPALALHIGKLRLRITILRNRI